MPNLFDPLHVGDLELRNRIWMAPLTRARASHDHIPNAMMLDYYRQRASAGLIISEATGISLQGLGWPYAPGLWSKPQIEAWKPITAAIHEAGGHIVSQLWHMGRVVHPSLPGRAPHPVSSSPTTAPGMAHTYGGKMPYVQARTLELHEIPAIIEDYSRAASNAIEAGFDGVQIHAANGYLIDQFLRNNANFRDDSYGGSIENRIRLLHEVTDAVASSIGASRTGVRLSPNGERQGVNDDNPEPLFVAAAEALSAIGIAFLELREPDMQGTNGKADRPPIAPLLREAFKGVFVLNADYDGPRAQAALDAGAADAISFGRPFISNPDLPRRIADKLPLAPDDIATWYTQGTDGYLSYPPAATA